MSRQKIKRVQIFSEKVRKAIFKRRIENLFKKAYELTILCGSEISIIIHDPSEGLTTLWPSQDKVAKALTKFRNIPEPERLKKMEGQEDFLLELVKDLTQMLSKLQERNNEVEMECLLNQLINGLTVKEVDASQISSLSSSIDEKLKKLQNRNEEIDEYQRQLPQIDFSPVVGTGTAQSNGVIASNSVSTFMEEMRRDNWFVKPWRVSKKSWPLKLLNLIKNSHRLFHKGLVMFQPVRAWIVFPLEPITTL